MPNDDFRLALARPVSNTQNPHNTQQPWNLLISTYLNLSQLQVVLASQRVVIIPMSNSMVLYLQYTLQFMGVVHVFRPHSEHLQILQQLLVEVVEFATVALFDLRHL